MFYLDAYFRLSAITLLLLTAVLLIRDARKIPAGWFGVGLCVCATAHLLRIAPEVQLPLSVTYGLLALNMVEQIFAWWFLLALLEDDFKLRKWHWGVFGVWVLSGIPNFQTIALREYDWEPISFWIRMIGGILIILHLAFKAFAGHAQDLVERRRTLRVFFMSIICLYILANTGFEIAGFLGIAGLTEGLASPIVYFALTLWALFWLGGIDVKALLFETDALQQAEPEFVLKLDPKEQLLQERLVAVIETEEVYKEQGLTISALANKIRAPEHQLRALINKTMGHRNFSSFLNGYRIHAAKEMLGDPENANLPVLTIAMDVGYASLAPFNRAFKDSTGQTPTSYRQELLSKKSLSPDLT